MEQKKDIYEIVDNYFYDEDSHFYCIDAYKWGEEEGHVVAVVHDSGDVWFCSPEARISEKVRNAINDVKDEIAKRKIEKRNPEGTHELWLRVGGHVFVTKDELDTLLKEYEKGQDELMEKIIKRSFIPEGNTYIPEYVIEEFNEEHGTDYDDSADYEFAVF